MNIFKAWYDRQEAAEDHQFLNFMIFGLIGIIVVGIIWGLYQSIRIPETIGSGWQGFPWMSLVVVGVLCLPMVLAFGRLYYYVVDWYRVE